MTRKPQTPLRVARALRQCFASQIAVTWADYFAERRQARFSGPYLNSYQFAKILQEQTGCTFRAATVALGIAIPELFAEYWAELPRTQKAGVQ